MPPLDIGPLAVSFRPVLSVHVMFHRSKMLLLAQVNLLRSTHQSHVGGTAPHCVLYCCTAVWLTLQWLAAWTAARALWLQC